MHDSFIMSTVKKPSPPPLPHEKVLTFPPARSFYIENLIKGETRMATVRLTATITGLSGRVGDTIYYTCRRKTFQRAVSAQHDPKTPRQLAMRDAFRAAVRAWQALSADEKAELNRRAAKKLSTGYNLFLSAFMRARRDHAGASPAAPEAHPRAVCRANAPTTARRLPDSAPNAGRCLRSALVPPSFLLYGSWRIPPVPPC